MFGESLIYSFFTFRSHQYCKMPIQKEKVQSGKRNVCGQQTNFSAVISLNKIMTPIFQIIHTQKKNSQPLSKSVTSKLVSSVFLLFDINVKEKRSRRNKIAWGQNCTKESWDNAAPWKLPHRKLPAEKLPHRKLPPRKLPPMKIASYENTHLWKFPL